MEPASHPVASPRARDGVPPPAATPPHLGRWRATTGLVHVLIFGPVAWNLLYGLPQGQPNLFPTHTAFAETAFDGLWHFGSPSQLWQAATKAIDVVLPGDIRFAALVAALVFYAFFGIAIAEVLRNRGAIGSVGPAAALGLSVVLAMLESPSGLWGWSGYMSTEPFLPLYLPFAATTLASLGPNVLLMWEVARWTSGEMPARERWHIGALLALASFAKPTLVPLLIVVVPALTIVRSRRADRAPHAPRLGEVARWLVLPGVAITLIQLLVTVRYVVNRGGWVLSPLTELHDLGADVPYFWLAVAFPLFALAVAGRRLLRDDAVLLGVLGAALGIVACLLLRRTGTSYQGDVLQLPEAALAMLMIFMPRRMIELWKRGELAPGQAVALIAGLVPYLVAGIFGWLWRLDVARPSL